MWNGFMAVLSLFMVFGILGVGLKYWKKYQVKISGNNEEKVIKKFHIDYDLYGYIVKIQDKYYFCSKNFGVPIEYKENVENTAVRKKIDFKESFTKKMKKYNKSL